MKRRQFMAAAGAVAVAGCQPAHQSTQTASEKNNKKFRWRMVTTWPTNFPGLGSAANQLATMIGEMSQGQLELKVYGAGELVPAFETFDAVAQGTAEMGHSAAYYWKGKAQAAQLFAAVPFGMNAQAMDAWLFFGGGLELWREVYAPFGVMPRPAGHTGVQMGGWFNKLIESPEDVVGLKMRIPGLGGEVWRRAGGVPVSRPGAEIFTALQTGDIDASEWVGPYNDLAFGLHKAAKYYYYPGWHEPDATLECLINQDAFNELPAHLQAVVEHACNSINMTVQAEYNAKNHQALKLLIDEHGVQVKNFPSEVLNKLRTIAKQTMDDLADQDAQVAKVWKSYYAFQQQVSAWQAISEKAYYNTQA